MSNEENQGVKSVRWGDDALKYINRFGLSIITRIDDDESQRITPTKIDKGIYQIMPVSDTNPLPIYDSAKTGFYSKLSYNDFLEYSVSHGSSIKAGATGITNVSKAFDNDISTFATVESVSPIAKLSMIFNIPLYIKEILMITEYNSKFLDATNNAFIDIISLTKSLSSVVDGWRTSGVSESDPPSDGHEVYNEYMPFRTSGGYYDYLINSNDLMTLRAIPNTPARVSNATVYFSDTAYKGLHIHGLYLIVSTEHEFLNFNKKISFPSGSAKYHTPILDVSGIKTLNLLLQGSGSGGAVADDTDVTIYWLNYDQFNQPSAPITARNYETYKTADEPDNIINVNIPVKSPFCVVKMERSSGTAEDLNLSLYGGGL